MKNSVININPDNGHINFMNLNISPEFKLSDLPDSFTKKISERMNDNTYLQTLNNLKIISSTISD
jgi:hypothetical protein